MTICRLYRSNNITFPIVHRNIHILVARCRDIRHGDKTPCIFKTFSVKTHFVIKRNIINSSVINQTYMSPIYLGINNNVVLNFNWLKSFFQRIQTPLVWIISIFIAEGELQKNHILRRFLWVWVLPIEYPPPKFPGTKPSFSPTAILYHIHCHFQVWWSHIQF